MKSLCTIGAIALIFSNVLSANEVEPIDYVSLSSETLSLPELLSYVEDTVWQLVNTDEETCHAAYHEFKESLKVVYTLNYLYPEDASTIVQTLDECYVDLVDAIGRRPDNNILKQSLSLFSSGRNYEHEALNVQSLQDWTNTTFSNELKSAIETTDADLVYIQDSVLCNVQKNTPTIAAYSPSRLLYGTCPSKHAIPKILIIKDKSNKSSDRLPEYEVEVGGSMKLGGKDHGKFSGYIGGEVKDKNGNYAKGKISKEKGSDGYDCDVKAGKEKKKK